MAVMRPKKQEEMDMIKLSNLVHILNDFNVIVASGTAQSDKILKIYENLFTAIQKETEKI
mgnify:CR=1 FL=1